MKLASPNYSKVLTSEVSSPTKPSSKFDLPQEVLESLFNISKSPEHEPNTMNWRNVVKKLQSVGPRFDVCPSGVTESQQELCAKGAEYHVYRKDAKQHWDSMKSSYPEAAYSKGDWQYAAYLSDQGKSQTKLARQADEKATQDIFKARLGGIAIAHVLSIQTLRVITGCGSHGVGKSKLKQSVWVLVISLHLLLLCLLCKRVCFVQVINLIEQENLRWSEENRGTGEMSELEDDLVVAHS
ncbi:hypothetical protein Patl1_31113 [Pistacia atlantica]|uniref:Uncharacterized protein n=1 Tax=Pistacia atlantica TaxID=434234 RepID=A0ACC1ADY2_9ROSI|nr:hypothetical protein Patl1_31113 [Pistacia atlantica]